MTAISQIYSFSHFRFIPQQNKLRLADETVILENRVATLLHYFLEHPNQVLTKEILLENVWQGRVVNEDSLSVAVSKLRKLLGQSRQQQNLLKTIPGVGYQWLAVPTLSDAEDNTPESSVSTLKQPRSRASRLVIPAVFSLALVVMILANWWPEPSPETSLTPEMQQALAYGQEIISDSANVPDPVLRYREAITHFRKVLEENPDNLAAQIGIGEAKFQLSAQNGYLDLALYQEEIQSILDFVLRTDPDYGPAWQLQAKLTFLGDWNLATAQQYYEHAIALTPTGNPQLYLGFSEFLITRGDFAYAEEMLRELRQNDPTFYRYLNLSFVYIMRGDLELALAETQRLVNTEVTSRSHHHILQRLGVLLGDDELAMANLQVSFDRYNMSDADRAPYLQAYSDGGIAAVYALLLEQQIELNLGQYIPPISWARYATVAGRHDDAIFWLTKAVEKRQAQALLVPVDPHYDALRTHPEFQALVQKIPH